MDKEHARELVSQWNEMNVENYETFRSLSLFQKRGLIRQLDLANKIVGKSGKHWAEKAIVWELWQELRLKWARPELR